MDQNVSEDLLEKPLKNCLRINFLTFFSSLKFINAFTLTSLLIYFFEKKKKIASKNKVRFIAVHAFPQRSLRGPDPWTESLLEQCLYQLRHGDLDTYTSSKCKFKLLGMEVS